MLPKENDIDLAANAMRRGRAPGGPGKGKGPAGAKVIESITHRRGADGTHHFTHHHLPPHNSPEHDEHVSFKPKAGSAEHHDAAVDHFIQHAIPPNPGEAMEPGNEAQEEAVGAAPEAE